MSDLLSPARLAALEPDARRRAFRAVFEREGPQVRGFLLAAGAADACDDLLQETFLRAYRRLGEGAGCPERWRGWLLTIARNLLVDRARRRAAEGKALEAHGEPGAAGEPEPEARGWVRAALAELDPELRALLLQRYGQGLWPRELAEGAECTERTIRNRIQRTLEGLTRALLARRKEPSRATAAPPLRLPRRETHNPTPARRPTSPNWAARCTPWPSPAAAPGTTWSTTASRLASPPPTAK